MVRRRKVIGLILVIIILTSFAPTITFAKSSRKTVIVGFKEKHNTRLITSNMGRVKKKYSVIPAVLARVPESAIGKLRKSKDVAFVEEDFEFQVLGQTLPWGINKIDAELVHPYNTGSGVQVAIVDTGVDYNHPDLSKNYAGGYDYYNGDAYPMDDHGHGTHCAGIVSAMHNDYGVVGVAPKTGIYGLKVLSSSGSGYLSHILSGIEWAVLGPDGVEGNEDDAEVISMSLGSTSGSYSLQLACQNAAASGTLVVAAAGNSGTSDASTDTVMYPAKLSSVIAVAATDSNDNRPYWSSSGPAVELAAPGVSIYSTVKGGSYTYKSGTSMACPHVAGVAALVYATTVPSTYDSDSDGVWDPSEVRAKLADSAVDLGVNGRDILYGYGRVDAEAAVSETTPKDPEPEPEAPLPEPEPLKVDLSVVKVEAPPTANVGDNGAVKVTVRNTGEAVISKPVVKVVDRFDNTVVDTKTLGTLEVGASATVTLNWYTYGANAGSHLLVATHTLNDDDRLNDEQSTTVTLVQSAEKMHVGDIDGYTQIRGKSGKWKATVTVLIHDENHNPVSGATVYGTWSGAYNRAVSTVTGSTGIATFSASKLKGSEVSFKVTNLVHPSLNYEPSTNHDPDHTGDSSSITLSK